MVYYWCGLAGSRMVLFIAVEVVDVNSCRGGGCQYLYRWWMSIAVEVVDVNSCRGGGCQ